MAVELSKLLRAKEEEDRDPAAKAAAWAELKASFERFHQRLEPIRADLKALPAGERVRFAPLGEDTPLWYLFRNRAPLRPAAEQARRQPPLPTLRSGSRPREHRPRRRSAGTSASRGDPPDEPPELVAPLAGGVR